MLRKLFIKDYKNIENQEVRFKYGIVASCYGVVTNILLFALKLVMGIISGSIAVISDAINNLTDGASSIVSVIGFKLASKPADKEHPFGHARYEYISAFIVSLFICLIGIMLCKSSIEKIINPAEISVNLMVCIILGISVLIKISQYFLYSSFGKTIKSDALKANAIDARNDIIITLTTLIAMVIIWVWGVNIDAYVGAGVSIFVVISGIKILIESINPLLGETPDKKLVKKIKVKLRSYEGVLGTHELMIHSYGTNINFASVHVEVSADIDPLVTHDLIDQIESDFLTDLNIHLVVHADPVQNNSERVKYLKEKTAKILKKINGKLSVHDFRIVEGQTHTNIVFDCIVPYEVKTTKEQILNVLSNGIKEENRVFNFVVDITRNYV